MQVQNGFGTFCQCKFEHCGCLVPLSALFGLKENEGVLEDNDSGLGDSPPLTPAVFAGKFVTSISENNRAKPRKALETKLSLQIGGLKIELAY